MEVTAKKFDAHLLHILRHIANAEFVAFDLEMSGIGSSIKHNNKPTLQEVYEDVKSAAETYQVLQVGITCIEKDEDHDMYIARPYNFNLSPLFLERDRLGIERKFSFSSGAMHFLLGEKINFDISKPFTEGVPYLSREEEEYARHKISNVVYNDVVIDPTDFEALAFYRESRRLIREWIDQEQTPEKLDFVNISLSGRYGIRLIHQLIKLEFPEMLARYNRDLSLMRVAIKDDVQEARFTDRKLQTFEKNIAKQTGLRYVFEALFGGDLSKLDPTWFVTDEDGDHVPLDFAAKKIEIANITKALKTRRPALVGHNMHTDLAFVYATFIGKLPETYEEFATHVNKMCPIVIDTKYLATHNCTTMDTTSDLHGVLKSFDEQYLPFVCLAERFSEYGGKGRYHEAGYDSWMTAKVLLKLASSLHAKQQFVPDTKENNALVMRPLHTPPRSYSPPRVYSPAESNDSSGSNSNGGVSLLDTDVGDFNQIAKTYNFNEIIGKTYGAQPVPRPSARTKLLPPTGEKYDLAVFQDFTALNGGGRSRKSTRPGEPEQWIPDWDSPFWNDYANKLRVFQASEGFMVLQDYSDS